jgi:hypothetical protein
MKKVTWLGLCLFLVAVMLLASCGTSATTTTQTFTTASTTTIPPGGETVLIVTEGSKVNNFSLMDLQALPSVTGNGGYMSQSGTIMGPFSYQGVALTNLLNTVGGISEGDSVVFTSSDNYTQALSYDQITNGNFNYYDTTGNPVTPQTMPTLTLIYSENGTLLDNTHGPVELGMLSPQNILTDGSLWAKMVTAITVTSDTGDHVSSTSQSTITTATTLTTTSSASSPTFKSTIDSVVQVWIIDPTTGSKNFEALGVPVGDGTTILTIMDYEDYTPTNGDIEVTTQNNETFLVSIQAIDARTGATLLKLDSGSLPPVPTRDPSTLKTNEPLIVWVQNNSDPVLEPTNVIGGPDTSPNSVPLYFGVGLPDGVYSGGVTQGAVVTDQSGKVLGLEGVYSYRLVIILGPIGRIPPIISIDSAAELLSPFANLQPWANGPCLFTSNVVGNYIGNYDENGSGYPALANAITQVLNELGASLSTSDLPRNFLSYAWSNALTQSSDGHLLTTVFPRPVNLCNSAGTVLAQAKWVGIQWDRNNGKPSRVVYGSTAYTVDGSFEITGDTSILDSVLQTS